MHILARKAAKEIKSLIADAEPSIAAWQGLKSINFDEEFETQWNLV